MATDLLQLIKNCKIFSSLDDESLTALINKSNTVLLEKHHILFRQGEISDALYVLISGKIKIILTTETREKKILNELFPGETIGELGALSHEPRSTTVKVVEDSTLLKISSEIFKELCLHYPTVALETVNLLVNRSQNLIRQISSQDAEKRHIAIIPANSETSLKKLFDKITEHTRSMSNIVLLAGEYDEIELRNKTSLAEQENKIILYFLTAEKTILSTICFENMDMMYVVANMPANIFLDSFTLEKSKQIKPELIILHEENTAPKETAKWLKLTSFGLHHHIRINQNNDIQRIWRFMRGQAIGVVLGGGGVRSWAHLGAIKALLENNIPIDIIGGTSAGAIVAGYYGLNETSEDPHATLRKLSAVTRQSATLKNLTWPAVSLFNAKDYTNMQKEIFRHARIEDLWLPCFFISCRLSDKKQIIHRKGRLWKIIRTSTSVPAIFPPVVTKGELYLDGGILNNLPVDIMKKIIGDRGTTIAVELTHRTRDKTKYHFPPVLPFWQTLLTKLHLAHRDYKFPRFVDTFLESLLAGSAAKQEENGLIADMLITPDLSPYSLLSVSQQQEAELVTLGYDAAVLALQKWQKKSKTIDLAIPPLPH